MDLKTYNIISDVQKELTYQDDQIKEIFKLFVLASGIKKLAFLNYNPKYQQFNYEYTLDANDIIEDDVELLNAHYTIELKNEDIIFGKFVFNEPISESQLTKNLLLKLNQTFKKRYTILNKLHLQESLIHIHIITDEATKKFAQKMKTNLDVLLDAEITISPSISKIKDDLSVKSAKTTIIYTVKNEDLIVQDEPSLSLFNEFVMVIGPNNHALSLICGKLNIQKYISIEEYSPEKVKEILISTKNQIQNKHKYDKKVISISGISGGVGTTTIAMNLADMIAQKKPDKNMLYIDLSTTKAISNLFLGQNPLPEKSIIDCVNIDDFSIEKLLNHGLVKISENFYSINGIQKHIDRDLIEQDIFIEKFLDFILKATEYFNYIIIDTGEADATSLKSTIYDIVDEIWMVTQMNLPHISKLKTFYSLIKRAGLKDKLFFLVNRFDSRNALSVNDVESILNTTEEDMLNFNLRIPNDYENLGRCWNYCELATRTAKDSVFVNMLEEILVKKNFFSESTETPVKKKSLFSFFSKGKA